MRKLIVEVERGDSDEAENVKKNRFQTSRDAAAVVHRQTPSCHPHRTTARVISGHRILLPPSCVLHALLCSSCLIVVLISFNILMLLFIKKKEVRWWHWRRRDIFDSDTLYCHHYYFSCSIFLLINLGYVWCTDERQVAPETLVITWEDDQICDFMSGLP